MQELNRLFRRRIGLTEHERITFERLHPVLDHTAKTIPFENMRIINRNTVDITKENLIHQLLVNREGGLCYELNSILYYFLVENGFHARLTRGTVYNHDTRQFSKLKGTHVAILLTYEGQTYVVDTGFGGNLPLKPVPLTGENVVSSNGEFRIRRVNSEHGDFIFEMKLKHKDTDWRIGYAFDSRKPVRDLTELNEIQRVIAEHPESPFNKEPLLTKLTDLGGITLTKSSITRRENGLVFKENIDESQFETLKKQYFG